MVNHMLEVKNHLKVVLKEQGWDDLASVNGERYKIVTLL